MPTQTRYAPVVGEAVNEVRLVGRVSVDPERRELPSGDVLWTLRIVVDRDPRDQRSRQRVDAIECAVWKGRARRSVSGWAAGDVVEVSGALRRRFFQTAAGSASRMEVDVVTAKLIRRSANG